MSSSTQARTWTVDEYHQMLQAGILTSDERVELLSGSILQMSPQEPPHAATTRRASRYLDRLLDNLADVRTQLPITLLPNSEPEPDIAIVRLDANAYGDRHPGVEDIFWAIEIADTTLRKDREIKALVYARARIREYWILDVNRQQAYILRNPNDRGYSSEAILTASDSVCSLAFPWLDISLSELFLPQ
ncbi:Uma2 family endonuclease [Oxynema aestuarii]|uniref:Uma2 family endonuclease n=1 Tax=Oxynema aestuarii AP17 TaxID=2064643 RepID=A0A6H1TRR4_9CYAN|nr:Uma2 family endonuclease [Oxynema aestuarii]QIZ69284.1 Uma2 family endonuclease [Oxynema aestuarii AP17]RMH75536.1 MAG: Uma2 family endonuclease [Cyanobacteria bacterium J007]